MCRVRDSLALATNAQIEELRNALAEQLAFEEDANKEAEAMRSQLQAECAERIRLEKRLARAAPREAELLETIRALKDQAQASNSVRARLRSADDLIMWSSDGPVLTFSHFVVQVLGFVQERIQNAPFEAALRSSVRSARPGTGSTVHASPIGGLAAPMSITLSPGRGLNASGASAASLFGGEGAAEAQRGAARAVAPLDSRSRRGSRGMSLPPGSSVRCRPAQHCGRCLCSMRTRHHAVCARC